MPELATVYELIVGLYQHDYINLHVSYIHQAKIFFPLMPATQTQHLLGPEVRTSVELRLESF